MTITEVRPHMPKEPVPGVDTFVKEIAKVHGVTPNPGRLFANPFTVAFEAIGGTTNVVACDYDPRDYDSHEKPLDAPIYALRGMLTHRKAIVTVDGGRKLYTESLPTTDAINDTQRTLGLTPGVDAFTFVRHPGKGRIGSGEWIRSLAAMQVPQSDINAEPTFYTSPHENKTYRYHEWESAQHDLLPGNHVTEWIITAHAPTVRDALVGSAQRLLTKYDILEFDSDDPHEDIKQFVKSSDRLDIFSKLIFKTVAQIEEAHPLDFASVIQNVQGIVNRGFGKHNYLDPYKQLHVAFGLLSQDATDEEVRQQNSVVFAEYAGATAKVFRRLEDIKPRPDDTPERRDARIGAWDSIIKTYSPEVKSQESAVLEKNVTLLQM